MEYFYYKIYKIVFEFGGVDCCCFFWLIGVDGFDLFFLLLLVLSLLVLIIVFCLNFMVLFVIWCVNKGLEYWLGLIFNLVECVGVFVLELSSNLCFSIGDFGIKLLRFL